MTHCVQPIGVICLHIAYLMVLSRLLAFVARAKSASVTRLRFYSRAVMVITAIGDIVHPPLPPPYPPPKSFPTIAAFLCISHFCLLRLPQIGVGGNFTCGGHLLSTLRQTAAAESAFASGSHALYIVYSPDNHITPRQRLARPRHRARRKQYPKHRLRCSRSAADVRGCHGASYCRRLHRGGR